MKKILLASAAIIGMAGTGLAADLGARVPVRAPAVFAPAFTWSGCYVGGFVGGAWGETDTKTDLGQNGTGPLFYNGVAAHAWAFDLDSSFIGGGTLGCNWQPVGSAFVFGIEGEGGYMRLSGSAFDPTFFVPGVANVLDTLATSRIGDWYGMITGRLGVAWDRALLYVKGGAAFVDRRWSVVDTCVTGGCGPWTVNAVSNDNTEATWTIGGGLEWAFSPNWSVKAEYMFIGDRDSDTACATAFVGGTTTAVGGGPFCWQNDFPGIHTAKLGLNYRFGWGP